jgi:hypothetical protein
MDKDIFNQDKINNYVKLLNKNNLSLLFEKQNIINYWWQKKIKIINENDLIIVINYLKFIGIKTYTIKFSHDYKFTYYNLTKEQLNDLRIRGETIFKLNILSICNKFIEYFGEKLKIDTGLEQRGMRELQLIKATSCLIYDFYIKIYNKDNSNEVFDYGLEYFEKDSHNYIKDSDKKIRSLFLLDYFKIFKEENEDMLKKFYEFLNEFIKNLFLIVCSLKDDPFTLSKINFFSKNRQMDKIELETMTNTFNNIMDIKKKKEFDLNELFEELQPIDPDTEDDLQFEEFIEYINKKIGKILLKKNNIYDDKVFDKIIVNLDNRCSQSLEAYKLIYIESMNMINDANLEIIKHVKSQNKHKNMIKTFMDNFILRLHKYNSNYHLEELSQNIAESKDVDNNYIIIDEDLPLKEKKNNINHFFEKYNGPLTIHYDETKLN